MPTNLNYYGIIEHTGTKVIVLCMDLRHLSHVPEDDPEVKPGIALVVDPNVLPPMLSDELREQIESPTVQNSREKALFNILFKIPFSTGEFITEYLHSRKAIISIDNSKVFLTPNPETKINVRDIVNEMDKLNNRTPQVPREEKTTSESVTKVEEPVDEVPEPPVVSDLEKRVQELEAKVEELSKPKKTTRRKTTAKS